MGKDDPKHIPLVGLAVPEALGGQGLVPWWFIIIIVLVILLVWEGFENVVLWVLGWKFEDRQDSFWNLLWDMIFGMATALVMWLFQWIIMDVLGALGRWFYVAGAISFGVVLLAYLIGYSMYKSQE